MSHCMALKQDMDHQLLESLLGHDLTSASELPTRPQTRQGSQGQCWGNSCRTQPHSMLSLRKENRWDMCLKTAPNLPRAF